MRASLFRRKGDISPAVDPRVKAFAELVHAFDRGDHLVAQGATRRLWGFNLAVARLPIGEKGGDL